jgi:beta-glucosidase
MHRAITSGFLLATASVFAGPAMLCAQEAKPAYLDTSLTPEQRADDIIRRLTPEEKASQFTNQSRAIPRLGIPAYNWWNEALHGVARNGYATVFPEPVGLAATFDPEAIRAMGVAIGTEARVKFNITTRGGVAPKVFQGIDFWSPNINIFRDPRWGRGQETYGEDPYLTGKIGTAFVQGMQGDDPHYYRVIATAKHYAVHSGPEPTRHEVDVPVSLHDAEDTYLPAFRELVTVGKVASVMCAYNRVNGQPACSSDFLLNDRLRKDWGFKGYVVSDCDAIADIQRGHHTVQTMPQAAAISLQHGVDNDCTQFNRPLDAQEDYGLYLDAMKQGLVTDDLVNTSLRRLFVARIRMGLFDPASQVPYEQVAESELNSPAHRALALKIASESMVLLKNDGVLPVKPTVKTIAVVGPLADQVDVMLGNYNGQPIHPVTAIDGIRAAFPNAKIVYQPGSNFLRSASTIPSSALTTADGETGLKAEFWSVPGFNGAPALTRVDRTVNFDRDMVPVLDAMQMSSRWTGFVTVPETGDYALGLSGSNAKLWVDDALAVTNGGRQNQPQLKPLHLEKGRHAVRIEQTPGRGPVIRLVWNRVVEDPLNRAVEAAKNADLVVAVAGISSALEGEEMTVNVPGFKGGDRASLDLPAEEENLLKAVQATGKPMVLVMMNGSALSVNWAAAHANAIIDAWYPGEQGGNAIGQTLSGASNPSGRLPVTFYTGADQLPPFEDYSMKGRTYRYFTGKPLYPFGHGLSYTRFAYGAPVLTSKVVKAGATLGVTAQVRNAGALAGDEVVQLYLTFPQAPGMPVRALRGFARVHLAPGEAKPVHFDLNPRDLSSVTPAGQRIVAPGAYTLSVGGGQPGTGAPVVETRFTIDGTTTLAN